MLCASGVEHSSDRISVSGHIGIFYSDRQTRPARHRRFPRERRTQTYGNTHI